jgi:asparagine synthase (glutamine-hydrolysing)
LQRVRLMCGIAGMLGPDADRSRVEAGLARLAHRGPDHTGMAVGNRYALGHTLLSIIGLEPILQPIQSFDGRIVVTFNGEIYNYIEILDSDPDIAARCSGNSDTEVLVEGLALYGIGFVERLNGMFAFAAVDTASGVAYLVRDRLGIKPLYFAQRGPNLCFASELEALRTLARLEHNPDPISYYSYARFRYPIGTRTFSGSAQILAPGTVLTIRRDGTQSIARYWSIEAVPEFEGTYEEAVAGAHELLADAITIQMRSDYSFCSYLSGGLDSSLLSALAIRAKGELDTYSVSIGSEAHDEGAFAAAVADRLHTTHHETRIEAGGFRTAMRELIDHTNSPVLVPNQVALSVLSHELSKTHRCVLSGEGADEVFGGYGRIFLLPIDWDLVNRDDPHSNHITRAKYGPEVFATYEDLFLARYSYVGHEDAMSVMQQYFPADELERARDIVETEIRASFARHDCDPFTRQLLVFQEIHLPGLLLRLDTATMAHSVEGRVPFLDHRLVQFMNALPIAYRMARLDTFDDAVASGLSADQLSEVHDVPKAVLKTIAADFLPEEIIYRRKLGFPVPTSYYATDGDSHPYVAWISENMSLLASNESRKEDAS